jgi:hypothetical protein
MTRKYDLNRMLKEIEEDQRVEKKKHQQLSQSEIRRMFADKRQKREPRR